VKILSLDLIAYGPFTGKSLNFEEGGANLHIVYGANEAGKSCTLRALSNALYGIPQDTKDAFLHLYDDLRIGLTLDSAQGAIQVVRRKGRANSLRRNDGSDSIFPPAEWSALLPVEDRDVFDRMFGVDHAEIAKGGELLLSSRSDLGSLLFAAAVGVDRLRAVQAELQKSAEELFTKRAQKTQINKAVAELKVAAAAVKQSLLLVGGYKQLRDSVEEAEEQSRKLEKAIGDASLEEQRLRRLQQAFPLVAKRQQRIEQLKQHEGSRTLPADFADRYRSAHDELRRSDSEIASQTRDIEGLQAKIDATPVALGILERESEIDLLYQQSGAVKKGVDDRVRRQQTLEMTRADAAALLDSIGVRMALEDAAKLRIPDPAQKRIFTLSTSKKAVDQGVEAGIRDLEKAREEQRKANQELTGLAVAVDTGDLEEALAMAPPGRDLEAEHSRLSNEAAAAKIELERSVSALPDWNGTLEQLAAAPAPLPETIAEFQNSFLQQSAEEKRLLAERARLQAERDRCERDLRKIAQEQEVPTEQDLGSIRTSRDSQWQTIRTAWLEAIAVDGPGLASSFETSVLTSDQIADRLRREAARVSEKAALLVSLERLEEQSATLELQIEAGQRGAAELRKKWESRWSATAVSPRTPLEMQSWLRQRDLILANTSELRKRQAEVAGLEESILATRQALTSKLEAIGGVAVDAGTPLAALAAQAKRAVFRQAELRQRKGALHAGVQRSVREIADLEDRLKAANSALSIWKGEWSQATEKLPVRRDASPEEVQVVLERITSLMAKIDEIGKLEDRIAKLTKDEAEFRLQVTSLVASARLEIPVENPFAAIIKLNAELQQNRTNRDLLKTFVKQSEDKQKLLAHSRDKAAACNALLVDLCKEAGAADPDSLPDCIGEAAEKRRIGGELSELEDNLTSFAGRETIAQLVVDLDALNLDELPNRIAQLQQQMEALGKQKADSDQTLGASRLELKQKEDADSVGQAAEDVEHLRSRIGNLTDEYVRLRLASRILANAVERYRDKNEGPLLKTAAKLFRQLTDDSFEDLRVDWNDQGEAELMGIRGANQKQVGVEGMSEATRDQLFLALRLAYVVNYCDAHGPVPFIADDVLMTFDDARATAALRALETLSNHTQVLLFTHHRHHLDLATSALTPAAYRVHNLG
jgi:uncharacterized protein YhaN